MYLFRKVPEWTPLYLLDGQSLLQHDPFLSELLLTGGVFTATQTLVRMAELVAGCLRQPTILALNPLTACGLEGEAAPTDGQSMAFAVAVPPASTPYDRAFRGLVHDRVARCKEAVVVITDDPPLRQEVVAHGCVVIGIADYRERAMRALGRRWGELEGTSEAGDDKGAWLEALIEASRRRPE